MRGRSHGSRSVAQASRNASEWRRRRRPRAIAESRRPRPAP
ncbi:hypothetical protein APY03_5111 [Variovorax sp. WDL1]|nr:hypothetical protein APY03_5111 [Variovorax sp. WDL1]